jgi:hypothetical protein
VVQVTLLLTIDAGEKARKLLKEDSSGVWIFSDEDIADTQEYYNNRKYSKNSTFSKVPAKSVQILFHSIWGMGHR